MISFLIVLEFFNLFSVFFSFAVKIPSLYILNFLSNIFISITVFNF